MCLAGSARGRVCVVFESNLVSFTLKSSRVICAVCEFGACNLCAFCLVGFCVLPVVFA